MPPRNSGLTMTAAASACAKCFLYGTICYIRNFSAAADSFNEVFAKEIPDEWTIWKITFVCRWCHLIRILKCERCTLPFIYGKNIACLQYKFWHFKEQRKETSMELENCPVSTIILYCFNFVFKGRFSNRFLMSSNSWMQYPIFEWVSL